LGEGSRLASIRLRDPHSGALGKYLGLATQVDQGYREGFVPVHLLVVPVGQVQPMLGQERRPALDEATARRPGRNLDLDLGTRGKDRCARQRQLVQADPGLGRCLILSPPGA